MREAGRRRGTGLGAVLAVLLAGGAHADPGPPAFGGLVARRPARIGAEARAAFAAGAAEIPGGLAAAPATTPPDAAALARLEAGRAALDRGEDAYLKVRLRNAERPLAQAFELLTGDDGSGDAESASRAAVLLAQVRLTLRREADADRALEAALRTVPRFPATRAAPPPEVATRIELLRARMADPPGAGLEVRSEPPGAAVYLDGAPAGRTPVVHGGLPPRPVRVRVDLPGGPPRERIVDLSAGSVRITVANEEAARAALQAALRAGDRPATLAAAARLEATVEAAETCVALATADARVAVVRLGGAGGALVGGAVVPAPADSAGWKALGRLCAASEEVEPADPEAAGALAERLWPRLDDPVEPLAGRGTLGRSTWGWGAVALGAVAAGAGTWFGLSALEAEADFRRAGGPEQADEARDRARGRALGADVSFVAAAGLVATGVYLLLSDAGGRTP